MLCRSAYRPLGSDSRGRETIERSIRLRLQAVREAAATARTSGAAMAGASLHWAREICACSRSRRGLPACLPASTTAQFHAVMRGL